MAEVTESNFLVETLADFNEETMKTAASELEYVPNYLCFEKGDLIRVCAVYESGWWYGHKEVEEEESKNDDENEAIKPKVMGFFPSNFVRKIEFAEGDDESEEGDEDEEESNEEEDQNNDDSNEDSDNNKEKPITDWMEYAQKMIYDEHFDENGNRKQKELTEEDLLNEANAPKNYNSVIGYKRIKISNDPIQLKKKRELMLNATAAPAPILNNEYAMIPVKQQDPNSKALRLLYHYFDYDRWIELKNKGFYSKKAKPDIRKKKPKRKKLNFKY